MSMSIDRAQVRFSLIVVGLVVAFAAGLWGPTYWQIRRIHRQIAQAESDLGIKRGRTDGLAMLAHEVEQLRREIAGTSKTIPAHADLAEVLRELSTQIEAEKLTSQGISTPAGVTADDHAEMPVQLSVRGPSTAVFALVRRVENLPRLIQFDSIRIQRDDKSPNQVQANMKLTTYYGTQEGSRS